MHSVWNMWMWEMARRETKAKGVTEAVRHLFCAIIWRHVKLHRSSKFVFFGKRALVITLDQGGEDHCTACCSDVRWLKFFSGTAALSFVNSCSETLHLNVNMLTSALYVCVCVSERELFASKVLNSTHLFFFFLQCFVV